MDRSKALQDLSDYLSGALAGDMGIRSPAGPMLDALMGAATSDHRRGPQWDGVSYPPSDPIRCRGSKSGPAESEAATARALHAVQRERRVRAAMSLLSARDARILTAYYAPIGPFAPAGLRGFGELRAVVAVVCGHAEARDAAERAGAQIQGDASQEARAEARQARRLARSQVSAMTQRAKLGLRRAHDAYMDAHDRARHAQRERRLERFRGMLA